MQNSKKSITTRVLCRKSVVAMLTRTCKSRIGVIKTTAVKNRLMKDIK
jgi:hypothetical protein